MFIFNKKNHYLSDYRFVDNILMKGGATGIATPTDPNALSQSFEAADIPRSNVEKAVAAVATPAVKQQSDMPAQLAAKSEDELVREAMIAAKSLEMGNNEQQLQESQEQTCSKESLPGESVIHKVPEGTILYHGTMTQKTFNITNIKLGKGSFVSYFSPQIRLAADYIMACAQPSKGGYIHKFRTNKDLKILILDPYSLPSNWSEDYINSEYCTNEKYIGRINGIGFYFPKDSQGKFTGKDEQITGRDFEIALCNPSLDLSYVNTSSCVSMRNLSDPYSFAAT